MQFNGYLNTILNYARSGTADDIDLIMNDLTLESSLPTTRYIDFALSCVTTTEGINRIKHYLFNGSQIQRNYACLFFNRMHEWPIVKKAFDLGLIDEIQAYSR